MPSKKVNFNYKITLQFCNSGMMFLDAEITAFNFCKAHINLNRKWNWIMVGLENKRSRLRCLEAGVVLPSLLMSCAV